ncbi:CCR4-NOT core subunit cdc39 [Malassezia cuniculi]|uniref:General negative regulator of transcription subunit 1 n=1 Tax=Malassezia cuniculi TaxID=948313 RepID=A0AAF0EW66_9BASI|nr:CCR4-NOT core subunit cdc39 [Malassezia cuniculi]
MAWRALRRLEYVLVALAFHLVFTWSIFDVYFRSPVVYPDERFSAASVASGTGPQQLDAPPADRLVLMVGDGLRADTLFQTHPWERLPVWAKHAAASGSAFLPRNESTAEVAPPERGVRVRVHAAPFLRTVAQTRGTYGVSHTRVPTESRPGHVALIAGMYEDMSAVTRGWKINPVAFDSVLNQSSHAYAFGSPDIVPMFVLGTPDGQSDSWVYDEEDEDFTKDATQLDLWVVERLEELLGAARTNATLDAQLRRPGTVFFLHLLGLDTTGHTYRPFSPEYVGNTIVVDDIARRVEELFREFFADEATAFVFTADHGMSRRGNHGDGDPDNTRTPVVAWGAGVPHARGSPTADVSDAYYANWDLPPRHDVAQADLAVLMASLIGIPVPAHAEGRLPLNYIDASPSYKAHALLANALQVLAIYRVKHDDREKRMLHFVPFPRLVDYEARVAAAREALSSGKFDAAIALCNALIDDALAGAKYLHQYDRLILGAIVVLGYIGLVAYGTTFLLGRYALESGASVEHHVSRSLLAATGLLLALAWSKFALERSPPMYFVYSGAAAAVWTIVACRVGTIEAAWAQRTSSARQIAVYLVLSLAVLQGMAAGYLSRWVWAPLIVAVAVAWPASLDGEARRRNASVLLLWTLLCTAAASFMLLSTEKDENLALLVAGGVVLLALGACVCLFPTALLGGSDVFWPRTKAALLYALVALVAAMIVTVSSARSLQAKSGLPLVNQLAGWAILVSSIGVPYAVGFQAPKGGNRQPVRQRLVVFVFALAPVFVILSLADEVLFFAVYAVWLVVWAAAEGALAQQQGDATPANAKSSSGWRLLQLDDVRVGITYLLLLHAGFFGTGNIASISSFYLSPVYRLVPVFNPFLMAMLLVLKLIAPFIVLATVVHALCGQPVSRGRTCAILGSGLGVRDVQLPITIAAVAADVLALNFFFSIRDYGSWLEIGQSITHFVMANLLQMYMLVIATASAELMGVSAPSAGIVRRTSPFARTLRSQTLPQSTLEEETPQFDDALSLAKSHVRHLLWQLEPANCDATKAELSLLCSEFGNPLVNHVVHWLQDAQDTSKEAVALLATARDWLPKMPDTMFAGIGGAAAPAPSSDSIVILAAAVDHLKANERAQPAALSPFFASLIDNTSFERSHKRQFFATARQTVGAETLAQSLQLALPHTAARTAAPLLLDLGPDGLASAELAGAILDRAEFSPSPESVAALLAPLLSASDTAPATDMRVLTTAVATRAGRGFAWSDAVRGLDAHELTLVPGAPLGTVLADMLLASPPSEPAAVAGLWGVWTRRLQQLMLLHALLQLDADVFSFAALPTRRVISAEDVASAPPAVQAAASAVLGSTWNALDLIETLMQLAGSATSSVTDDSHDVGKAFTLILERGIKTHAECVLLGLVQLPQPPSPVQLQLVSKLLIMFLAGHASHQFVFWALWHKTPSLLLEAFGRLYAENPLNLQRLIEVAHEQGFLREMLADRTTDFALDAAALASRYEYIALDQWLQQQINEDPEMISKTLDFVEAKVKDDLLRRDPQADPTFVPLAVHTVATILRVLRMNGDQMAATEIEHFKVVRNLCLQLYPRLMSLVPGAEAQEPGLAVATFPTDIHREADTWYRQMYEEKISVDDLVALLQRSRESSDPHDTQLFACMVHTLFDEHRWFELYYPPRELLMTAAVFGTLIQRRLIDTIPLGIAIRYVLDALRMPPDSTMFHFGVQALLRFQGRLVEWPQLCNALLGLPHLAQTHPEIVALATRALAAVENAPAETSIADISPDPLPATPQRAPEESVSDKILFLVNNMSPTNLPEKLAAARPLLTAEIFHWFAKYLVGERVGTEPNNHGLYVQFLDGLQRDIYTYVLYETLLQVHVLLDSDKTSQSAAERTRLKNLAAWLGTITLARDRPLLHRNISLKSILQHGYDSGRLIVAIPFVCKVLEQCASSRVFHPPNPWVMGVVRALVELYQHAELKLNLKFEIEVLCKCLGLDVHQIEPASVITDREQYTNTSPLTQQLDKMSVKDYEREPPEPRSAPGPTPTDSSAALLQSVAPYITINPALVPYANNAAWKRILFVALERAVREIIAPVVERSVTIASISTRELVGKDFAMEPDETRLRAAAHHMAQTMAGSLALVTCKEPLRMSIAAHARSLFAASGVGEQQLPEQGLHFLVQDNLDLACSVVEKTAMEQALVKVDEGLATAYALRREHATHPRAAVFWDSSSLAHYSTTLPDILRIAPPGLQPQQLRVYEDIGLGPLALEQRDPEFDEVSSALAPTLVLERFVVMAGELEVLLADAGEIQSLASLPSGHLVTQIAPHVARLVAQGAPRDETVLLLAQKAVQLLYRAQTTLAREVWVLVLEQLCELSLKVAKEVTAWLVHAEDERKFNVPVTLVLLRANLIAVGELDRQLAKTLLRGHYGTNALEYAAQLVHELVVVPGAAVARVQFANVIAALQRAAQHGQSSPTTTRVLQELEERSDSAASGTVAGTPTAPLREQLAYSFASWVRVYQQSPSPDKSFIEFVTQLQSQNVLKGEEISSLFFRVCTEVAVEHYHKQRAVGGTPATGLYAPIDTFAKMIVYMVKYHADPLGADDAQAKVHYLAKIMSIVVLVLAASHEEMGSRFQQRPFFRLFSSIMHDLHSARASLQGVYSRALLTVAHSLNTLQPLFFPGFAFSWLSLVSHRMFLPKLLGAGRPGTAAFHRLFVAHLRFMAPFLAGGVLHDTTRLLYKATLRILLLLLHDFPEYLAEHAHALCVLLPAPCIQMRNVILCAYPPSVRLPHPFATQVPDVQTDAVVVANVRSTIAAVPGLVEALDAHLTGNAQKTIVAQLCDAFRAARGSERYNFALMGAVVLYSATAALGDGQLQAPHAAQTADVVGALVPSVLAELDAEGRYLLLSAAANELRFPSQHTFFFARLFVAVYTNAVDDSTREQVLRVLLERVLAHRPHPWGLLYTLARLLRTSNVQLPGAPREISAILEHMSQLLADASLDRAEDSTIFKAAARVPQVAPPRHELLFSLIELAIAVVLLATHLVGYSYWVEDAEWQTRGIFVWSYLVFVHLISISRQWQLRAAKLFPTLTYALITLSNARTALLIPYDEDTRSLTLFQAAAGVVALAVCMLVPVSDAEAPVFAVAREMTLTAPQGEMEPLNARASLLSRMTFGYMTPLLIRFYGKVLSAADMPQIPPSMHAAADVADFRLGHGKLRWRLAKQFSVSIAIHLALSLMRTFCSMMPVVCLQNLLAYSTGRAGPSAPPKHVGVLLAFGILAALCADALCRAQVLMQGRHTAVRLRSVLFTQVLSKALRRRIVRTGLASDGQITNLVGVDISKVVEFVAMIHQPMVEQPLLIVLSIIYLVHLLGSAALVGVGIMILALPLQVALSKAALRVQEQMLRSTDTRLDQLSEVLSSIKTVKFFAWERPFAALLRSARANELHMLRRSLVLDVVYDFAFVGVPMLVTMATFGVHTLLFHRPLTAQTAFTALAIFNMLRAPLADMPEMVMRCLAASVSLGRIDTFLNEPETEKYEQLAGATSDIGFAHGSFTHDARDDAPLALADISCAFPPGVSIVVGPVGSGKSSLLLALLGELQRANGETFMPDSTNATVDDDGLTSSAAYCTQNSWILGTSVRENILFGTPYDEARYRQVLYACALEPDLDTLEFFDATEVGEKGTTLSGGQKARVALARALYSRARYVLIDDALSAVDAHTAQHLVEHALCGKLAQGRTIVLVTHSVSLVLPVAVYAVSLEHGEIMAQGNPAELVERGLIPMSDSNQSESTRIIGRPLADEQWHAAIKRREAHIDRNAEKISVSRTNIGQYARYGAAAAAVPGIAFALWALVAALYASVRGADVAASSWLRQWARSYDLEDTAASHGTSYYLGVYAALVAVFVLVTVARDATQYSISLNISRHLYDNVVASLLHAKPQFYDRTPIGRIMNRLSKDMETVDQEITTSLQMLIEALVNFIAILAVICWATPRFLIGLVFVVLIYWSIATLYMHSSRQVKRIDSTERSPLYTLIGETLAGTVTIRAFGAGNTVMTNCLGLLDRAARPFLLLWMENRWLSVRVDIAGAFIAFSTAFLLVLQDADAALVGFTLSYAVLIVNVVLRIVRRFTLTEINMNAVERIGEYIDIEPEKQGGTAPPAHWPTDSGNIIVKDLAVRYGTEFPRALDGVSFEVRPGEKVGIVGRTGSGKSTLSLAFFRFLEAEAGSIEIDGINIADIPLDSLRRQLTIIPQDSQLFKGTVRSNLDPFGTVDDADMWSALRRCQLVHVDASGNIKSNSAVTSLDDTVEQGGTNFSAGQRQLLSLARGMIKLRNSRILILDESTANLDSESDALIQRTIREEMAPGATILTVAHRLKTIIDYDKVLVLGYGRVLEFGSPAQLLANKESAFFSLCANSGDLDMLRDAVKNSQ